VVGAGAITGGVITGVTLVRFESNGRRGSGMAASDLDLFAL
jgi:hypothetical protein